MTFIYRYRFSLLFLASTTILIVVFANDGLEDKYFLSAIGALITLYIGLTQYQINNDKIFKELFNDFNQKYDENFNDLINRISLTEEPINLSIDDKNLIIDYLNLCAEEYLWYKQGRIPKDVWDSWKNGIEKNLDLDEIRKVVSQDLEKYKNSYYGLFDEINFKKHLYNPSGKA